MPYVSINGKVLGDRKTGLSYQFLLEQVCAVIPTHQHPPACEVEVLPELGGGGAVKPCPNRKKEEDEEVIEPCGEKKKGFIYDDPPTVGSKRIMMEAKGSIGTLPSNTILEKDTFMPVGTSGMILLCMIVVGALYYRMKKSATKTSASSNKRRL